MLDWYYPIVEWYGILQIPFIFDIFIFNILFPIVFQIWIISIGMS